jgi:hypothetical protein
MTMAQNDEQQKWRVALRMFEKSRAALADANDLCRSAMAIAKRRGRSTNWEAFERKLEGSLKRQHEAMYAKPGEQEK